MEMWIHKVQKFWRDEEGVVAIEYGLMAVFIALAIAVGAGLLGDGLNTLFTNIGGCFTGSDICPVTLPGAI